MNPTELILINRGLQDLNPLLIGKEDCAPGHSSGPAVRNFTLLHYVISGQGIFRTGDKTYTVKGGEIYRILPGELCYYRADDDNPWCYRWLGFNGALSEHFSTLPPVFSASSVAAQCFALEDNEDEVSEYRIAAKLFRLYAELFETKEPKTASFVRRVRDYVDTTYMISDLRVEEIANHLHLDRRYLSRIFKNRTGQTIQEYITSTRMAAAMQHLSDGFSVAQTAERCGYTDAFLFSKMFKRHVGISPAYWKKERR